MASNPKIVILIDGNVRKWTDYTRSEPDGDGGATVTIVLARPDYVVNTTSHVVVREGHDRGRAGLTTVFDTSLMASSQYTIEIEGDTLTVAFRSRLNDKQDLAPREEREYFYPKKTGLHGLMRFVAGKIGYTSVRTNLPNISLPWRIPIQCTESYWDVLMRFVDPLGPLVLPDEGRGILYVWSLDVAIPGSPYRLPLKRSEAVSFPKEPRKYVNQAVIRWLPSGEDGPHPNFDCGGETNHYSDPSGDLVATTRQLCGEPIDLESAATSATLEERVFHEEAPDQDETGPVLVERRELYAVWRNPDTGEIDDDKLVKQTITTYGADGTTKINPLYRTFMTNLYVPGTDFQKSAGHTSKTEGYEDEPGVGRKWFEDLYRETESIVYGVFASRPGELIKLYSTKQTRGRILMPEKVPLYRGSNSRIVNVASTSDQWTTVGPLTWEVESLGTGGSTNLKYLKRVYNYLTKRWSDGTSGDALGSQPNEAGSKPEPIEELIQDEASVDDPAIGPRTAVEIDATWVGTEVEELAGGEADRTIGREWAIEMALARFRRSGKRIVTLNSTQAKLLTRLHRGAIVRATKRGATNPHDYVVTGFKVKARITGPDNFSYTSAIVGRRLERGTEDNDPAPGGELTGVPIGMFPLIFTHWDA